MNILFRVDGHAGVGFGHLVRCLALADCLRDTHGARCAFVTMKDTPAVVHIENAGHLAWPVHKEPCRMEGDAILFDLQAGVTPELLHSAPDGALTVDLNLTDAATPEHCADMIFHPLVHPWFLAHSPWQAIPDSKKHGGPEYALIRPQFGQTQLEPAQPPRIFVSGGASDQKDIVMMALHALDSLEREFVFDVMVSRIYPRMDESSYFAQRAAHETVWWTEPDRPWEVMARCTLAVLAFGMTAFETMAVGLPTATLATSDDHDSAMETLEGIMPLCLARSDYAPDMIKAAGIDLLDNKGIGGIDIRAGLSQMSRLVVDGKGVERVARKIVEAIDART